MIDSNTAQAESGPSDAPPPAQAGPARPTISASKIKGAKQSGPTALGQGAASLAPAKAAQPANAVIAGSLELPSEAKAADPVIIPPADNTVTETADAASGSQTFLDVVANLTGEPANAKKPVVKPDKSASADAGDKDAVSSETGAQPVAVAADPSIAGGTTAVAAVVGLALPVTTGKSGAETPGTGSIDAVGAAGTTPGAAAATAALNNSITDGAKSVGPAIGHPASTTDGKGKADKPAKLQAATAQTAETAPAEISADASKTKAGGQTTDVSKAKAGAEPAKDAAPDASQSSSDTAAGTPPADPAKADPVRLDQQPQSDAAAPDVSVNAAKAELLRHDQAPQQDASATAKPGADALPAYPIAQNTPAAAPATLDKAGAAAPAAAAVPISGIAVEITSKARDGKNSFDIRLDPPELGRIHVRLDVSRDGEITSHVIADRSDTLDLLRRDSGSLERALQDAGLKTANNGLQYSLRDHGFGRNDQPTQTAASSQLVVSDEPAETILPVYRVLAGARAGVDIRV